MSERKDGGPAFPIVRRNTKPEVFPGMSLRDWFAGQAIKAIGITSDCLITKKERRESFALMAMMAYEIADAMIEARGK